jgi:alkaline phosphatase D
MTETPIVGAVTSSSAKVTVRTSAAADVKVEYAENLNFNNSTTTSASTTASADDFATTISLSSLSADQMHWYKILVDDVEQSTGYVQKFKTFPSGSATVKFAAVCYKSGKDDGALFAIQLGDFDHRDPTTLSAMRTMHRDMKDSSKSHGGDFAQHISSKMGVVHMWDDHDYGGQDEDRHFAGRADAWQAFKEHWPTYTLANGSNGLWHSFTCGDAEVFVLDLRSQRDDGSDTDNSDKSMLDGALITDDQKDWLLNGLRLSDATWKIVLTSVSTNADARPTSIDLWHSFSTEAQEIADYITNNSIENVVLISGDIHTGGGIDDGTNGLWGQPEMTVPHTNLAGGNKSNLGTWSEGVTPGKPGGKGYGLVTVSSTSLTLEAKAQNGNLRRSLTLTAV